MQHTTLTPSLERASLNNNYNNNEKLSLIQLRNMVIDAISKNLYSTASFFSERLIRYPDAEPSDSILFARCYLLGGEPRRCLAALEQRGLLSATDLQNVSEALHPLSKNKSITIDKHVLSAINLASKCLLTLEQYDDCIALLDPLIILDDSTANGEAIAWCRQIISSSSSPSEINIMSAIYCTIGRCYDALDNRPKALKALVSAIRIDVACIEAVEYIGINGMMSSKEKILLFHKAIAICEGREWLEGYYRFMLLNESPENVDDVGSNNTTENIENHMKSAIWLARSAEYKYDQHFSEEAYRLSRHAYTLDPFDPRGLMVYIASMVDLNLKTELFYLAHELANTYPRMAISWYAVGCYYWACKKLEMGQRFLVKATKIDKTFAKAWVILGHVLSAQEESEHAISAFRTASRLLPGDHRPLVFMAKELVRTNYLSLALNLLSAALEISPSDPTVLNELGVVYIRLDRLDEAIDHFSRAVAIVQSSSVSSHENASFRKGFGEEIFSNYATALRKCKRFDDALHWYSLCLAINPMDAGTHASIAFTHHLCQRYDDAISSYHRALGLQPTYTFCSEMLSRAMDDIIKYSKFDDSSSLDYSKFRTETCKSPSTIDNEGMSIGSNSYGTPEEIEYFESNSYSRVVSNMTLGPSDSFES